MNEQLWNGRLQVAKLLPGPPCWVQSRFLGPLNPDSPVKWQWVKGDNSSLSPHLVIEKGFITHDLYNISLIKDSKDSRSVWKANYLPSSNWVFKIMRIMRNWSWEIMRVGIWFCLSFSPWKAKSISFRLALIRRTGAREAFWRPCGSSSGHYYFS